MACQCVQTEGQLFFGRRLLLRMDNSAAVHYINFRYGRVPELELLAESLERAERSAGCCVLAKHIPGKANVIADEGSRDASFASRWACDIFRDAMLRRDLFDKLRADLGHFSLDLFADRSGASALVEAWCYPEMSAFERSLLGELVWAHPPRALIPRVLEHVRAQQRLHGAIFVALLVPCDSGAPWFRPHLLRQLRRRQCWPAGSDLFRWPSEDSPSGSLIFRKHARSDLPYVVLTTW